MVQSIRLLCILCLLAPLIAGALGASQWVSWAGGLAGCCTLFGVRLALVNHKGRDAGR